MDESWVKNRLEHYHKAVGIKTPQSIFYSEKSFSAYMRGKEGNSYAELIERGEILGSNYKKGEAIFINMDVLKAEPELEETIVHETVHTRYPKLKHGGEFKHYINQIKKGNYNPTYKWWNLAKDWVIGY